MAFLPACEKKSDNPTVELLNGDFIAASTTISPGGSLKFKWKATKGKADLASFTLRLDGQDQGRFPNDNIPADVYIDSTYLEGPLNSGDYVYSFVAADVDGNTGDKTLVISVE